MAESVKSTLQQVKYTNINDFVQVINQNFAIIQNSPLFRGIPGNPGKDADPGKPGKRGSLFIFIDFGKLQNSFGDELLIDSRLTVEWMNSVLINNTRLQLFCNACNITELSHNDTFVLPNTSLFQYDEIHNRFVDTGKSLNMYRDTLSGITKQVEDYIQRAIGNLRVPGQQQTGVYKAYATGGVNYENGSASVDLLLDDTMLFPTGFDTKNQVNKTELDALHHAFAGNDNSDITQILGDARRFNEILQATIKAGSNSNSIRTINKDSIPGLIMLQKTADAGFLIGSKHAQTIRDFAEIYMDQPVGKSLTDFVIQSNRYPNTEPSLRQFYSQLRINNARMQFTKNLDILGDSELKGNTYIGGDIESKAIRTGEKTKVTTDQRKKRTEIGYADFSGYLEFIDKVIRFKHHLNGVLSTDSTGMVVLRSVDNTELQTNNNRTNIVWNPSDLNSVVIAKQLKPLLDQFNLLQEYVNTLVTIKSLETGIPNLKVSENLTFVDSNNLGNIKVAFNQDKVEFKYPVHFGDKIKLRQPSKVIATDGNSEITYRYSIEDQPEEMSKGMFQHGENKNRLVTSYHLAWIVDNLGGVVDQIGNGVWTKADFNNANVSVIGGRKLKLVGDATIETPYLKQKKSGSSAILEIIGKAKLNDYRANRVLTTNTSSEIDDSYSVLSDIVIPESYSVSEVAAPNTSLLTGLHLRKVLELLAKYKLTLSKDFYTKTDFSSTAHPIDTMRAKNITFNQSLKLYEANNSDNPKFEVTENATKINTENIHLGGFLRVGNRQNPVNKHFQTVMTLTYHTDNYGKVHTSSDDSSTFYIENSDRLSSGTLYGQTVDPDTCFNKNEEGSNLSKLFDTTAHEPLMYGTPDMENGLLSKKTGNIIFRMFNSILKRLKKTPTAEQTMKMIYDHMPVGSIIMWTYESSIMGGFMQEHKIKVASRFSDGSTSDYWTTERTVKVPCLPLGWVPCDGQIYSVRTAGVGTQRDFQTPDLRNKFVMMDTNGPGDRFKIYLDGGIEFDGTRYTSATKYGQSLSGLCSLMFRRHNHLGFKPQPGMPTNLNDPLKPLVGTDVQHTFDPTQEWDSTLGYLLKQSDLPTMDIQSTEVSGFEHGHAVHANYAGKPITITTEFRRGAPSRGSVPPSPGSNTPGVRFLDEYLNRPNENGLVILLEGPSFVANGPQNGYPLSTATMYLHEQRQYEAKYPNVLKQRQELILSMANRRELSGNPSINMLDISPADGRLLYTSTFDIRPSVGWNPIVKSSIRGTNSQNEKFGSPVQTHIPLLPHHSVLYIIKVDSRPEAIYQKTKNDTPSMHNWGSLTDSIMY